MQKTLVFAPILAVLLVVRVATNVRLGLYNRGWRFASVPELERIVIAVVTGTAIAMAVVYGAAFLGASLTQDFPRSFWIAELLVTLAVLGGVRFTIRAATEWTPERGQTTNSPLRRPTLLYGAGRTGASMAASAVRKPQAGVLPVGFLDDDPHLAGGMVGDLRVFGGLEALDTRSPRPAPRRWSSRCRTLPGRTIRQVVDAALERGLEVRTVPSMSDLLDGTLDAYRVRRVQVEDLLRRTTATEHAAAVHEIDRRPGRAHHRRRWIDRLRAGAPGLRTRPAPARPRRSGGERRCTSSSASSRPSVIAMTLRRAAGRISRTSPAAPRWIASSRAERPDVIFHAAAYKHVPMMEEHPSDAVHVNVGGTMALLDAAIARGRRAVRPRVDGQGRPTDERHGREQARRRDARRRRRATDRPAVRLGPLRQRPRVERQRRADLPGAAREGRAADDHPPRDDPLLHDDPRSGLADPRRGRARATRATCSSSTWASRSGSSTWPATSSGSPDATRTRQPMEIVGLRPGEKLHEELFYEAEQVEPTTVAKVLRATLSAPADLQNRSTCCCRSRPADARATFGPPSSTSRRARTMESEDGRQPAR